MYAVILAATDVTEMETISEIESVRVAVCWTNTLINMEERPVLARHVTRVRGDVMIFG